MIDERDLDLIVFGLKKRGLLPDIVHCRECESYNGQDDEIGTCDLGCESTGLYSIVEPQGFCAWGRKRITERTCRRITHGLERDREVATVSWTCSACGSHIGRDHAYCPYCGAKVVEE